MKGKATNEQLAKVLEYTLSEHQKNIEKSEKERAIFLKDFRNEIESLKGISLSPNLVEFKHLNEQLEKGCVNGAEQIKSALKNVYFSPLVLGIVFTVFVSGVGIPDLAKSGVSFSPSEKLTPPLAINVAGIAKDIALKVANLVYKQSKGMGY